MMVGRTRKEKNDDEVVFERAVEDRGWCGNKKVMKHFYKLGMITADTKKKLLSETKKDLSKKSVKRRSN